MNGLTKVANRMGRGYSFAAIRAKMLYGISRRGELKLPPFGDSESGFPRKEGRAS